MQRTNEKRIFILNSSEEAELYARPNFSHQERDEYFYLDDESQVIVDGLRKRETKAYFILLLGYFRAKPVIHHFNFTDVETDLDYVCKKYFNRKPGSWPEPPLSTRTKLINKVLNVTGFSLYKPNRHKAKLLSRIQDIATICIEPKYVFDECLTFFGQQHIVLAGYTTLQEIVSEVLVSERLRVEKLLSSCLSEKVKSQLRKVLYAKDAISGLSHLKQAGKDFSHAEINRELESHGAIKDMYLELKGFVEKLALSQGNLRYYAALVEHKSSYKLRRMAEGQAFLYLACYFYFRYRESNDNLLSAFIHLVRKHQEAAKAFAKQKIADDLEVVRDKLKLTANLLRSFVDDEINDATAFGEVRKSAFELIPKNEIRLISDHIDNKGFDPSDYEWQYVDANWHRILRPLRKIFLAIDIEYDPMVSHLAQQLSNAKEQLKLKKSISSIDQQRFLVRTGSVR